MEKLSKIPEHKALNVMGLVSTGLGCSQESTAAGRNRLGMPPVSKSPFIGSDEVGMKFNPKV